MPIRLLTALTMLLFIGACSTAPKQPAQPEHPPADQYYDEARKAQIDGDHNNALKYFAKLENVYPFSPYSQLAPLEMAYAHYKLGNNEQSINESSRFIATYSDHTSLDYAYYLKGLAQSDLAIGTSAEPPEQNVIVDDSRARDAFKSFSIIVQRFPESKYHNNAQQQTVKIRKLIAMQELQGMKDKLAEGDRESALKMAKYISDNYPNTTAASQAFELIAESSSSTITPETKQIAIMHAMEPGEIPQTTHHETWILEQNPEHYTLQLMGTSDKSKLEQYIHQHGLENDSAYYQRQLNDKPWYSLIYGNYPTRDEAKGDATALKTQLGLKNIWIRQFSDVQILIPKVRPAN